MSNKATVRLNGFKNANKYNLLNYLNEKKKDFLHKQTQNLKHLIA